MSRSHHSKINLNLEMCNRQTIKLAYVFMA